MPHELPKAYDPTAIEDHWAGYWVRENLFATQTPTETGAKNAEGYSPAAQAFTILLPPPNVTGRLHMGHMLNQTEMDILTRWHRMLGEPTLWVPGTDHAGIATQMMVEKQVTAEGTTRQALGRTAFLERVWQWKALYGGAILDQMKRLGASVDWQREYFTMDANLSTAVREAFTRLYHEGLIYKGAYIVNWCPGCQTAISDLEVVHEETAGKLWEIRYPVANPDGSPSNEALTIATTRPETMLGDVAVAIHPEDERYKHLHGKRLILPLTGRLIPIILDEWVSRDFGTGAVKVTPAHDPNDFALAQRHHLPSINIMDDRAKIALSGSKYDGLDRYEARKRIVEDLAEEGLLGTIHEHKLSLGRCDRSKDVVEPRLSEQWFVAVNKVPEGRQDSMAGLAIKAAKAADDGGKAPIRFTPSMYEKTYLNWMENIHDWCISRQLWWGHRIPAWHCAACRQITVPKPGQQEDPTTCTHCGKQELHQETDVLDTWFSSGLLPVSVFGWPFLNQSSTPTACHPEQSEGSASSPAGAPGLATGVPGDRSSSLGWSETGVSRDFTTFYPTSLLVTGFDILFFWVARMIMLGAWFAQDVPMPDGSPRPLSESVPFRDVYIHALVRDANREKMSKTKGNVIDPIEIVKQYGTDAVRFTLASMASPGTDIAFNIARTEGYRAFANKIWNAARFIFMNLDRAKEAGITVDLSRLGGMPSAAAGHSGQESTVTGNPSQEGSVKGHDFSRADKAHNSRGALAPAENAPLEARWIVSEFHATAKLVNESLTNYRYDDAANHIYQFFWGSFCDWYLEIVKLRLDFTEGADKAATTVALTTLMQVFEASLRLLSPFMPFLTEEIWHAIYDNNPPAKSIALTHYPQTENGIGDMDAKADMFNLQALIVDIRALRKDRGAPERKPAPILIAVSASFRDALVNNEDIIRHLALVESFTPANPGEFAIRPGHRSGEHWSIDVLFERTIDIPAERERLTKEIAKLEKNLASAERQLGNESFLSKAPVNIVEGLKKQQSENSQLLEKAQAALTALG